MTNVPETHRDLLDAQFATLATIGPDGRPQLTEVWFLASDGQVRLSLNRSRQKTKNLERNSACSLFIVDTANPYRYVELRGDAAIEPDANYTFADLVGKKYDADLREHDGPGDTRVVVTVQPARVNAVDMSG
ncbi:MAG TPA: PPOX class F420-dependent oxidoreductase [Acidimicrobiia bacterium]|jgi:PPOX class probable F420-dependent enzyme